MKHLFVLVSTGQNVANLPPVLEMARPEDRFLWVESSKAQQGKWSQGATEILSQFGLREDKPIRVEDINEPAQVVEACKPRLALYPRDQFQVILVANGGLKLTPIGLLLAWRTTEPVVIYGNDTPCGYWLFKEGWDRPAIRTDYTKHRLDLIDILKARGYQFFNTSYKKIWPNTKQSFTYGDSYGIDEKYTCKFHLDHWKWFETKVEPLEYPIYEKIPYIVDENRMKKWLRSFKPIFQHAFNQTYDAVLKQLPSRQQKLIEHFNIEQIVEQQIGSLTNSAGSVYGAALSLARDAMLSQPRQSSEAPDSRLGTGLPIFQAASLSLECQ